MTIKNIINTISLFFGFISSLWFIKGTITLNGEAINKLSGTYWGQNPYLLKTLARQRVEYILGALFLCLSFSVQLISQVVPVKFLLLTLLSLENSIYFVLDIIFLFLFLSWFVYNYLKRETEEEIKLAKQKTDEKRKKNESLQNQ